MIHIFINFKIKLSILLHLIFIICMLVIVYNNISSNKLFVFMLGCLLVLIWSIKSVFKVLEDIRSKCTKEEIGQIKVHFF